jgi:hypothetical protein
MNCQADINGGKHPQAIYRVRAGGHTFNACYRCLGAIGFESRRSGIKFNARWIDKDIGVASRCEA